MGRKKALLIGINYLGSQHQLQGCIDDVSNVTEFLISRGFSTHPSSMVTLTDDSDPRSPYFPSGHNILAAMHWLVSEPGCTCFLHYSGHGGQVPDEEGYHSSGFADTIVPVDFERNGMIESGRLHRVLVSGMAPGCQLFIIFDCCHR
jgi:metacaspase-1